MSIILKSLFSSKLNAKTNIILLSSSFWKKYLTMRSTSLINKDAIIEKIATTASLNYAVDLRMHGLTTDGLPILRWFHAVSLSGFPFIHFLAFLSTTFLASHLEAREHCTAVPINLFGFRSHPMFSASAGVLPRV